MTLYLELPGSGGRLDRLLGEFGAVALPGPPGGLDEMPPDRALICVVDMGDYEAPGYITTEIELAAWADPADTRPRTTVRRPEGCSRSWRRVQEMRRARQRLQSAWPFRLGPVLPGQQCYLAGGGPGDG